jgi:hypothetical protein
MASSNKTFPAPIFAQVSSAPSQTVITAALWLASIPVAECPRPLVPHLRREFDVTAIRREGRK